MFALALGREGEREERGREGEGGRRRERGACSQLLCYTLKNGERFSRAWLHQYRVYSHYFKTLKVKLGWYHLKKTNKFTGYFPRYWLFW